MMNMMSKKHGNSNKGEKKMKKLCLSVSVFCMAMVFLVSVASASSILHMDIEGYATGIDEITLNPCDDFIVHLCITDVPDPGLTSWSHDIEMDGPVEFVDFQASSAWDAYDGVVEGSSLEMYGLDFTGISGSTVLLADITFHCLGVGTALLTQGWHFPIAQNFVLGNGSVLDTGMGFPETSSFDPLTITINQVPIPATVLLLASGLVGLYGISRRRRK